MQSTASMRQTVEAQKTTAPNVTRPANAPTSRSAQPPKGLPATRAAAVTAASHRSELEERLQYLLQVDEGPQGSAASGDAMRVLAELRRRRQERKAVAPRRHATETLMSADNRHVASLVFACEARSDDAAIDCLRECHRSQQTSASSSSGGSEKGHLLVGTALAEFLLKRRADESDISEALSLLDDAVAGRHAGAMLLVGLCLRDGVGVPADLEAALTWVERAADAGYAPAMFELAVMYEDGVENCGDSTLPSDWGEAMEWYQSAADRGHTMSQLNLGKLFWKAAEMACEAKPSGCDKKTVSALKRKSRVWLEMAAASGNEEAVRLLRCR